MTLKPYPTYKHSGVEWLGDVPDGWDVKRLKYLASINDGTLPETTDPAEQRAIADFLYRETGKIDRLVAQKRELIGKLKEERAAAR